MSQNLILHYAPDNASLCVRLALHALDLPYRTALVDRAAKAQKSDAFLALNPNGLIPVLETCEGPMFETGAILMWLADREGRLMPPPDHPDRMYAVQWLMWLANTMHPTLRMVFYPDQYGPDDAAPAIRQSARDRLSKQLTLLQEAATCDWLDADALNAQGCYLAPMLRWAALYGGGAEWFELQDWPRLHAFAQRFEGHPATIAAARCEGLGPTPFSNPSPCQPPEGSAV